MKSNRILSFLFVGILFASCKEQIPAGLVLNSLTSKDTTYIDNNLETPQIKKVVIEELTGVACANCPDGSKQLRDFTTQYPDRIILAALHSGFLTTPPPNAIYDFRNSSADDLNLFLAGQLNSPKPCATFDRAPVTINGDLTYFIVRGNTGGDWISALTDRLNKTTPVNIHLTSSFDENNKKVNVTAKLQFTQDVNENLALTLYVLESGKIDVQDSANVELEHYEFNHVLQKIITPVSGEPILDSLPNKVKGRVLQKVFSFEPNLQGINAWNIDKCVIVAIVHKTGSSKEILHAEEVNLK